MDWFLYDMDFCYERVNVTLSDHQEKVRDLKSYYKSNDLRACSFSKGYLYSYENLNLLL